MYFPPRASYIGKAVVPRHPLHRRRTRRSPRWPPAWVAMLRRVRSSRRVRFHSRRRRWRIRDALRLATKCRAPWGASVVPTSVKFHRWPATLARAFITRQPHQARSSPAPPWQLSASSAQSHTDCARDELGHRPRVARGSGRRCLRRYSRQSPNLRGHVRRATKSLRRVYYEE